MAQPFGSPTQRYLQSALMDEDDPTREGYGDGNRDLGGDLNVPMTGPTSGGQGARFGPGAPPAAGSPVAGLQTKTRGLNDEQQMNAAYGSFLGRQPGAGELSAHYNNPGGLTGALGSIYNSPEASNRRTANPNQASAITAGPFLDGSENTPPAAGGGGRRGWNNLSLDPRSGGGGGAWSGFNNDRALAGGDPNSVKDAFFRFGQGFNFDPRGKSKEEIEAFLRTQIGPSNEYGLNILDVQGDQILVQTKESPEPVWVDVVGNAGGTGDSPWQWIDQSTLGDGGGGDAGGGGGLPSDLMSALSGLGGSSTTDDIMEELQAVISGRPSPTNQRHLQSALNG